MVARQQSVGSENAVLITSRPKSPQHHTILVEKNEWDEGKPKQPWGAPASADLPRFASPEKTAFKVVFTARKRKSNVLCVICWTLIAFGMVVYCYLTGNFRTLSEEADAARTVNNQMKIQFRSAEKDVRMLARDFKYATKKTEEAAPSKHQQDLDHANQSLQRAESVFRETRDRISALQQSIQKHSFHMAAQKYGTGPHRVEFTLRFPSGEPGSFTAEMAPLEEMPHSVQIFLDMASNGLWDGCSFVMNALHVLKTAPLPYEGSRQTAADLTQAFRHARLTGPSFSEFSDRNPHEKYTLGLSLQGEAPSFFINTDDNTSLHEGESAFAKVVSGFETIEALLRYPTNNGIWLEDRIGIETARVHA